MDLHNKFFCAFFVSGFYPVLQTFYILFVFLVIIIIVLSVVVWKIHRRQCPRCGEVRPVVSCQYDLARRLDVCKVNPGLRKCDYV